MSPAGTSLCKLDPQASALATLIPPRARLGRRISQVIRASREEESTSGLMNVSSCSFEKPMGTHHHATRERFQSEEEPALANTAICETTPCAQRSSQPVSGLAAVVSEPRLET